MILLTDAIPDKPQVGVSEADPPARERAGNTCSYQTPLLHGSDARDAAVKLEQMTKWIRAAAEGATKSSSPSPGCLMAPDMHRLAFIFCVLASLVGFFVVYNVAVHVLWLAPLTASYDIFALSSIFRHAERMK